MREGSLDAPTRHPLDWQNPEFYDMAAINRELERVFDICHGCRRCFNLCDSFPTLFDLIDESDTGEIDGIDPETDYKKVVDLCTLCDLCFMTKCPYVPPHEFNLDFPHLMLRYRAAERKAGEKNRTIEQLTKTDRNGKILTKVSGLANWGSKTGNRLTRPAMEKVAGIDRRADLPAYASKPFTKQAASEPVAVNRDAPAFGKRKAVIYATCFVNYNTTETGRAARAVLAKNGVETEVVHPACCGMPYLEQGALDKVAAQSAKVKAALMPYVSQGYDIIALTASCGLMLKFEWPLLLPDDEDLKKLADATFDIDEYVVDIAKKDGLADGLTPIDGGVTIHLACHARAQNMGPKGADMLRLLPDTKVDVIERCSGHGGTFGIMKQTHDHALKVGKNAGRAAKRLGNAHLVSECPLAAKHLKQIMALEEAENIPDTTPHPIELIAKSYGLT